MKYWNPREELKNALSGTEDVEFIYIFIDGKKTTTLDSVPSKTHALLTVTALSANYEFITKWLTEDSVPKIVAKEHNSETIRVDSN